MLDAMIMVVVPVKLEGCIDAAYRFEVDGVVYAAPVYRGTVGILHVLAVGMALKAIKLDGIAGS